ncbi:polysaccharide deacetylase family protein [Kitasatospora sp. NA04385]|uniref:polysaccharide deacetylase family protein n=1 Tax=Kitasatospora sp. NA04385 TaxID=2742135 RepID=UPI00158FB482|nr:polysaccharide deacetylase family protein [Kitasatospora sp. NA04385]QKW22715.1 polysaccharide deacetylase family protein [Kitasatospora sp. NA04385]
MLSSSRRRLAALAATAALASLATAPAAHADAPAPAPNLATNPGFEIPTLPLADWGSIPGWHCAAGEGAVTAAARTGGSALAITPASGDSTGQCAQTLAVRPNTTYTYSAWVHGSYAFLGASGTGHDVPPAWTASTGAGWQRLSTTFTTGAATTSVQLYAHGWYGQGPVSVDDVSVTGDRPTPAPLVTGVPTGDKVVFVTIDDGWTRDPAVVQLIADRKVPVTAFPLPMPEGFEPDYFSRATAVPGSAIEDHSVSHRDLTTLSPAEQQAEICDARDAVAAHYGTVPTLFRPPYFAVDANLQQAAANCGMKYLVTANADFGWGASNTSHPGGALQAGDIVILHFTDTLADDLQRTLDAAARAGLKPAALGDYLR